MKIARSPAPSLAVAPILPRRDRADISAPVEIVIPVTDIAVLAPVIDAAEQWSSGLHARLQLLFVRVLPFPLPLEPSETTRQHIVTQASRFTASCALTVTVQIVFARSLGEGYRYALRPNSTVLLGTRRRWWPTREERLARELVSGGHNVGLMQVEPAWPIATTAIEEFDA